MDYQLVIKFWRKSLADEAFLATIESELKNALGDSVELEGYDVGPKEINFFMLTADPRIAFRKARDVLSGKASPMASPPRSGGSGGAESTSVWPLRAMRKFKLP